jgi:chromosome segregation ATPase
VAALASAVEAAVPPDGRSELDQARAARRAIEPRFDRLPRTPQQVTERLARARSRVDGIDREAFRLEIVARGCAAVIGGSEAFVEQRRSELSADAAGSQELAEELRKHRAVVEGYAGELGALRQEIARVRDATGSVDAVAEESRLRTEYLQAVERERLAAEAARGAASAQVRSLFDRVDAARAQLERFRARARVLEGGLVEAAKHRAASLRERVAEERVALAAQDGALDVVQAASRELFGAVALHAMTEVRAQLHRLVLKADLGLVDVAWSRKRQRLEKIQQLAVQKNVETDQLEREHRPLLREVD